MTVRVVGETFQLYNEDSEKPSRENVQTTLFFFFLSTKKTKKQKNREKINAPTWCPNPTRNSAKLIHTAALQPTMTKTSLHHGKRATCTSPFLLNVERTYIMKCKGFISKEV